MFRPFGSESNNPTTLFSQLSFLKRRILSYFMNQISDILFTVGTIYQQILYWLLTSLQHSRVFRFAFIDAQCKQTNKCFIVL